MLRGESFLKFESLALTKAEIKQLSTDLRNESGYKFAYRPFDDYVYVITNKQSEKWIFMKNIIPKFSIFEPCTAKLMIPVWESSQNLPHESCEKPGFKIKLNRFLSPDQLNTSTMKNTILESKRVRCVRNV